MGLTNALRVRRSHFFWHLIFFALVLVIIFYAIRGLKEVLTPLAASLLLSYLLDPLVCFLERRTRMPRWLGSIVLFVVALLLFSIILLLVVPVLVREIHAFAEAVPGYVATIQNALIPWVEGTFSITVPRSLSELAGGLGTNLQEMVSKALAPLGGMAGRVAVQAASLFSALAPLVLVPIFTFYFLPNFPAIIKGAEGLIPRRYLPWVRESVLEIDQALAAWIRGQVTVMSILAVLYSVGLSIVGIKMAVLIGALTGLLAFIPYVGVVVGFSLALLVALLEYHGYGQLLGIVIVFGVVQTVEGLFLTPFLVGEKVGLGPVGVLIALMIGGNLFGFVGVLIAVPTAAATVVLLRRGHASYQRSLFYQKGNSSLPVAGPGAADPGGP